MPRRSLVGHKADILRSALLRKLETGNDGQNGRIMAAVSLCDRFLNSTHSSEEGLQFLRQQVHTTLTQGGVKERAHRRSLSKAAKTGNADESKPQCSNGGRAEVAAADSGAAACQPKPIDWSMPPALLQQKAFAGGTGYGTIVRQQDALDHRNDVIRAKNKADFQARTRQLLNTQMEERRAAAEEMRAAQLEQAEQLCRDIAAYEKQEMDRMLKQQAAKKEMHRIYSSQVKLAQDRKRELREAELLQGRIERREMELAVRQEAAAKAALRQEQSAAMMRLAQENQQQELLKQEEAAARRDREHQFNLQYMKMMLEKEQQQVKLQQERKKKMEQAAKSGGAEELKAEMELRSAQDEQRARQQQDEHDRQQAEAARQKAQRRRRDLEEMKQTLDQQMADKWRALQLRQQEDLETRKKAEASALEWKQQQKQEKRERKAKNRKTLMEMKELMEEEAKKRYQMAQDLIPENESWVHRKVLEGGRAFTTFTATKPVV